MSLLEKTSGIVKYRGSSCVLELSKDFGDYYYSLIPKYKNAQKQKYNAHVTIVREFEKPHKVFALKTFDGWSFDIDYSPTICYSYPYFFLECDSESIKNMRELFELSPYRINNCYHITIGNTK